MKWEEIAGHTSLKKMLQQSISEGRIGHAQLFSGKSGYGTFALALAYARAVFEKENPSGGARVDHWEHVDLHFSFPVFRENNESLSGRMGKEFREMMMQNPYSTIHDWSRLLDSQNKQLQISVAEVESITDKFVLKSFEGGTKMLIIWCAEKINEKGANKLLKFLEEPPEKTVIILISEEAETMLPTILSRVQVVEIPRISDKEMVDYLQKKFPNEQINSGIAERAQGDLNKAQEILLRQNANAEFEAKFVQWVRDAYMVKKKPALLKNIIQWAREIAGWNREKQKNFLEYCAENFRLAMLQNYTQGNLVYRKIEENFSWEKFSEKIHGSNIADILKEISDADYHLERNGNPKIVWTDMGIKLTRYLHRNP